MTRYRVGKFDRTFNVIPGDTLIIALQECCYDGTLVVEHKIEEEITVAQVVSHWVMFYVPGVGFGGMFGGPDIEDRIDEVFVDPVKVEDGESLLDA